MAGGAVIQVVATGPQDVYLTSEPTLTFFKAVTRRHTNFAIEAVEQTFNGTPSFGQKVQTQITRNGDLIHKMYLKVQLPALTESATGVHDAAWVPEIGHSLIEYVTLTIGGQQIDKLYGEWLSIWNELSNPEGKQAGYRDLIGDRTVLKTAATSVAAATIYVPMTFFFNQNPGLALPLIALAYHEVRVEVSFRPASVLTRHVNPTPLTLAGASLYVDYIFLDAEERKNFAQSPHEYLIEQLQFTGSEAVTSTSSQRSRLSLNHPVKELVWAIRPTGAGLMTFDVSGADTIASAKLQLNGNDRFTERDAMSFNIIQPYQHHTRIPRKGIYVYSFALKPEELQPSGTLNFSRIDNATLQLTNPTVGDLFVFAKNFNIFRVVSGMGGVTYNS